MTPTPIERVEATEFVNVALDLPHNLTAYDALYVAVARHIGCPLATRDRRLATAPGSGIALTLV